MILIIISLILGFLGFMLGGFLGLELFAYVFGIIGFLSPILYVLENIYNQTKHRNTVINDINYDCLDSLKSNDILTDEEYEKAYLKFNEIKGENENRAKYEDSVKLLYEIAQERIISDSNFNDKVKSLKSLYKQ